MSNEYFLHCCRLCLHDGSKHDLLDVFSVTGLSDKILEVYDINMSAADKITTNICIQCFQEVLTFVKQRKLYEEEKKRILNNLRCIPWQESYDTRGIQSLKPDGCNDEAHTQEATTAKTSCQAAETSSCKKQVDSYNASSSKSKEKDIEEIITNLRRAMFTANPSHSSKTKSKKKPKQKDKTSEQRNVVLPSGSKRLRFKNQEDRDKDSTLLPALKRSNHSEHLDQRNDLSNTQNDELDSNWASVKQLDMSTNMFSDRGAQNEISATLNEKTVCTTPSTPYTVTAPQSSSAIGQKKSSTEPSQENTPIVGKIISNTSTNGCTTAATPAPVVHASPFSSVTVATTTVKQTTSASAFTNEPNLTNTVKPLDKTYIITSSHTTDSKGLASSHHNHEHCSSTSTVVRPRATTSTTEKAMVKQATSEPVVPTVPKLKLLRQLSENSVPSRGIVDTKLLGQQKKVAQNNEEIWKVQSQSLPNVRKTVTSPPMLRVLPGTAWIAGLAMQPDEFGQRNNPNSDGPIVCGSSLQNENAGTQAPVTTLNSPRGQSRLIAGMKKRCHSIAGIRVRTNLFDESNETAQFGSIPKMVLIGNVEAGSSPLPLVSCLRIDDSSKSTSIAPKTLQSNSSAGGALNIPSRCQQTSYTPTHVVSRFPLNVINHTGNNGTAQYQYRSSGGTMNDVSHSAAGEPDGTVASASYTAVLSEGENRLAAVIPTVLKPNTSGDVNASTHTTNRNTSPYLGTNAGLPSSISTAIAPQHAINLSIQNAPWNSASKSHTATQAKGVLICQFCGDWFLNEALIVAHLSQTHLLPVSQKK